MTHPKILLLMLAFMLPASTLLAQSQTAVITGTVSNAESGAPVSDAHVFIAASMAGSVTNEDGRYRLVGVPFGAHRLYVSIVGYEPQPLDIFIRRPGEHTFDFSLEPAVVQIGVIEVTGERDERWRRQLEKFIRLFIGETPNAGQTEILNPEVLDFSDKAGRFSARASETLVIENRALGYRVRYFLKEFIATPTRVKYDGEPLFEEMVPSSPEEAARWQVSRAEAFDGSFRHFMLAVLNGRVEESGFKTYHRAAEGGGIAADPVPANHRFPLDVTTVLKPGTDEHERILDVHGFVEIIYLGEVEDASYLSWRGESHRRPKYRTSMIRLGSGPAVIDLKGDPVDPYGVIFYGYLAFERVADDVPREYRPWQSGR